MLAQAELRSYLQLAFTPYLGIVSFLRLINHWQHPKRILDMSFSAVRPWLDKPNQVQPYWNSSQILTTMVEPALIWLNEGKNNCHILTLFDDDYPLSLSEIHHPPPVLFLKGNLHLLTLKKNSNCRQPSSHTARIGYRQTDSRKFKCPKFLYCFRYGFRY